MKKLQTPSPVVDLVFLDLIFMVVIAAAWPIYHTFWLFCAGAGALVAANVIVWLAVSSQWKWWKTLGLGTIAYLLVALLVGTPAIYSQPSQIPVLLFGDFTAPVTGWKNLLTLELPVGAYRDALAPMVFLIMVSAAVAFGIAWSRRRTWGWAVASPWLALSFTAAFGSALPWEALPGVSWNLIGGAVAFLLSLSWALVRLGLLRRRALVAASQRSGASVSSPLSFGRLFRSAVGVGMVVVAVAGGVFATPAVLDNHDRSTLRDRVDPALLLAQQLSPLATYREFFTDERIDELLFTVSGGGDRVRLATLNYYDGTVASVVDNPAEASFIRVPWRLYAATDVDEIDVDIAGLQGAWVPLVGKLESIDFAGPRRASLADGFFYSPDSGTGINVIDGGLQTGDGIRQDAAPLLVAESQISSFRPARSSRWAAEDSLPDSVSQWTAAQDLGTDGASLLELITRLRQRGYLSHSLLTEDDRVPAWAERRSMSVIPSRAGHSMARIDGIFTDLLERQSSMPPDASEAVLVAAVGDDEQFAVAAAMIADQLGYDVRVAMGAVLNRDSDDADAVPTCDQGACRGGNISAWIEVRDGQTDDWAAIDVTPQSANPPQPDPEERSEPKNFTPVHPKRAESLPPPVPMPRESGEPPEPVDSPSEPREVSTIWKAVAGASLVVLLLALPLIGVVGAKSLRTRRRRNHPDPRRRVLGGWDQFVDEAVDYGLPAPGVRTRQETAAVYSALDPGAVYLAQGGDFAAFSSDPVSDAQAQYYWQVVGNARKSLSQHEDASSTWRAKIALKSLRKSHKRQRSGE